MQYNTLMEYPFTVDYYKAENTVLQSPVGPPTPPVWAETFIKEVKVQLGSDPIQLLRLQLFTAEELAIGYVLRNVRDANGNVILKGAPNNFQIDTSAFRVNSCTPVLNMFGFLEGYKVSVQQLNALRAA